MENEVLYLPCYVFVYGTLMSGRGNNRLLARSSRLVCEDYTTPDHVMTSSGIPFVSPFDPVKHPTNSVGRVRGEVWEVSDLDTMYSLDLLEGHPNSYTRTMIQTSKGYDAWIYYWLRGDRTFRLPYCQPDDNGVICYHA